MSARHKLEYNRHQSSMTSAHPSDSDLSPLANFWLPQPDAKCGQAIKICACGSRAAQLLTICIARPAQRLLFIVRKMTKIEAT